MSEITSPVVLDETLQETNERLLEIRHALNGLGKTGIIYGFHIDSNESDPSDAVTYLEDARGMSPAYMDFTNDVFAWGSWKDAFFMPRPCMLKYDGTVDYYLMESDYTKKADGTASDVANDSYGGNAMMEWGQYGKKIWYKIVPDVGDDTSASIYIADHKADNDFEAWSFINNQGKYVNHFYTPIYNGWYDGARLRSISGKSPTASQNAATERSRCQANNASLDIWDMEVFCDITLIQLLLILISKSLNSQAVFGQGNTTSGSVLSTGTMNTKGLFWGSSGTTSGVKCFGMEHFWGNLWRRYLGHVNASGTEKYKLTRGTEDGSNTMDYIVSNTGSDYNGYLTGSSIPSASGNFINKMKFKKYSYIPSSTSGNDSTYYADGFWSNNSQCNLAYRGGSCGNGSHCGLACLYLDTLASGAHWAIAAAPSCKPL